MFLSAQMSVVVFLILLGTGCDVSTHAPGKEARPIPPQVRDRGQEGPLRARVERKPLAEEPPPLPRGIDGFFRFPASGNVGDWVEYRTTYTGSDRTERVYWALVTRDEEGGWIERRIPWTGQRYVVTRFFVDPSGRVTRAYAGLAGSVGRMITIHEALDEGDREEVDRGIERLETPQGPLECSRVTYDGDFGEAVVWVSDRVPFEGIVRTETDSVRVELVGFGVGAAPTLEIPND